MFTSYRTAVSLAVLSGVIAGVVVGRIRSAAYQNEERLSAWNWAVLGGIGAAVIFGALVAFHGVFLFLTGPEPTGSILGFTILVVVLLAFVCVLP